MAIVVDQPLPVGTGIDLCRIWLNDAVDPADAAAFRSVTEALSQSTSLAAEVRQLIGRRRVVVREGARPYESHDLVLPHCNPEQVAWVRAHIGRIVCVRDHVGSKVFGIYSEVGRDVDTMVRDRIRVTIKVDQVDFSEAV